MEAMIEALREECSFYRNTEYAYTFKYGELRVLCAELYTEVIIEYAKRFGVKITSIHTY